MNFHSLRLVVFVCTTVGLLPQTPAQSGQGAGECDHAVTTAAMRDCEASRYATAQRELDSAYRNLVKHLDDEQKRKLRITQRAWLRFREADADFQASLVRSGTLAPLVRTGSLTEMTKARTEELIEELIKEALP
ncbi:MAG TPA: lysozyme inhibitor LprI family protein [Terriglobales bacterium]|nr:lysozyme inhibitor LprI family protein [Terriglobales bacterium]